MDKLAVKEKRAGDRASVWHVLLAGPVLRQLAPCNDDSDATESDEDFNAPVTTATAVSKKVRKRPPTKKPKLSALPGLHVQ